MRRHRRDGPQGHADSYAEEARQSQRWHDRSGQQLARVKWLLAAKTGIVRQGPTHMRTRSATRSSNAHLQAGADERLERRAVWPLQRRGRHGARDDEQCSHWVQVRIRRLPNRQLQGEGQSLLAAGVGLTRPTACWLHVSWSHSAIACCSATTRQSTTESAAVREHCAAHGASNCIQRPRPAKCMQPPVDRAATRHLVAPRWP